MLDDGLMTDEMYQKKMQEIEEIEHEDLNDKEYRLRIYGIMTTVILIVSLLTLLVSIISIVHTNIKFEQAKEDMVEIADGISVIGSDINDLESTFYYIMSRPNK